MPVVKINTLKLPDLKEILSDKRFSTEGLKNELVLRLSEAVGSDSIEIANANVQELITELRDMFSSVLQMLQANNNVGDTDTRGERERLSSLATSATTISGRSSYSVKEIAEAIPEFDPTNESSISVEQFVERVNSAIQAYQWEEECLLLAVYSRLKGAAKHWLNSTEKLYASWSELSKW
ncbi:PREDICTED: uncharacterized protein LOC108358171 [Rhagoletis zephyria]|uniref:uncharacterized protein LOC108358171 n=1 Tax=Rhagoletis zephyria TaxID=28612 RepID=UPI00081120CF|nr:PREDICTED: uncharacterized protein LOC108358171 [Rhagoletis zephyria]